MKWRDFTLSSGNYEDVNSVYSSLSDKEKNFVTPGRRIYKDLPAALSARTVAYCGKSPAGFVDIYGPFADPKHPKERPHYTIETAVSSEHRGLGLSPVMAKDAIRKVVRQIVANRKDAQSRGLLVGNEPDEFRWEFLGGNGNSERAAISAGLKKKKRQIYTLGMEDAIREYGSEKKADDARNRMVSGNRMASGLPVSSEGRKGRYAGGAFGGSAWDNGDGTTTVRKGNNELTVPSKAHQSAMRTVGPRNTSFLVPGALASGVVDSAADVAFIPQSFEPIVNAVSPSAAGAYSRFFDGISGGLRNAAGKIRAATDGNPQTIPSDSGTWNKKDPAAGSGMNLQDVSKAVSFGPRAYLSWRYALKPLLRAGKWLSTGTSGSATAARMASGAGFARHGADLIEEGSPIAGAAVMAAGTLGMAGPMGSGRGVIQGLQKGVNRFASPVLERLSALSQRVPLVGRHIGTAIDSHIPTGLAVSPDPHVLTR